MPKKSALSDFKLLTLLGKGNFGKVYLQTNFLSYVIALWYFQVILARQATTGSVVAIKVIRKDMTVANDDVVCAFIERNVLTKTHLHPFLTKMYCSFQTEVSITSGNVLISNLHKSTLLYFNLRCIYKSRGITSDSGYNTILTTYD